MADEIHYDYGSMDAAYDRMKQISGKIESSCQDMSSDAKRLLESSDGHYAQGYQTKLNSLNTQIDELNIQMSQRATNLQQQFHDMGALDVQLGSGF